MRNIYNFKTTNIWLSLESFYNDGLTQDECKEIIENIKDGNNHYLKTEPSGFNHNLIVKTCYTSKENIFLLCDYISCKLEEFLRQKKKCEKEI